MGLSDLKAHVLRHLPKIDDPNVLVGTETADDAAVYRINDRQALVLTVDYFTPVVDDPYAFGQIAAANALSDVYAMGGRPMVALNVVGFPKRSADLPLEVLGDILRGGADKAAEAGIFIAGGHSIDDPEPKYGLFVVGMIDPDRILTNAGARPGDRLVLTKPVGTGIISTAIKRGVASPEMIDHTVKVMAALNRAACEAALSVGVNACTDVTGYGLLGHLRGVAAGSRVGAEVRLRDVPVLPGVRDLLDQDMAPGGTHNNLEQVGGDVSFDPALSENDRLLLADAQTSGGLLLSVPADRAERLIEALRAVGTPSAAEVGEITEGEPGRIRVKL